MTLPVPLTRPPRWLPLGRSLPAEVWAVRHRWVVTVLAVQAALLPLFALSRGLSPGHAVLEAGIPAALVLVAGLPKLGPTVRGGAAAAGLMVVSSLVVHLSDGAVEAHFLFFAMIPLVALYESWIPVGLAVAYVLLHHGLVGTRFAAAVYDQESAQQRPWTWAAVHAGLFAVACLGSVVNWRLHQDARAVEQQLHTDLAKQAQVDPLTGLPNRAHLHERGRRAIAEALAEDRPLTVLVLDLDRFKQINDTLGHAWGDALLSEVGPRLQEALRGSDVLARLGGDEFAVLLPGLGPEQAEEVAARLRERLHRGFVIDGMDLDVDASIGVATLTTCAGPGGPSDGPTIDDLLRQADVAMYAAKESGVGAVAYSPEQDANSRARLSLLSELRRALAEGQLLLHFQPKLEVATGAVSGAEALVRWQHPRRGLLMPVDFIPDAESTPLVLALTDHIIELALAAARTWHDDGRPLHVAVNVPPRCLLDGEFPARIDAALSRHQLAARFLRIEITETTLMSDPEAALVSLQALAGLGVGLSIDDFGTGYSSMSYLRRLPVDELKVDRTFTMGMTTSTGDAILVRSAIDLGHNLGLTVVAEGVEDAKTLQALSEQGCDSAQGYHISRPMPPAQLRGWLKTQNVVGRVRVPIRS